MGSWLAGIGRRYPEEDREEGLQRLQTQQICVPLIFFDVSWWILVTFIGLRLGTLLRSLQFRDWCSHSLSKDGLGSRLTAYGLHMFFHETEIHDQCKISCRQDHPQVGPSIPKTGFECLCPANYPPLSCSVDEAFNKTADFQIRWATSTNSFT